MAEEHKQSRHRPEGPVEPKVKCQVCMKEIPESEARSREGDDYTLYFCGIDCYNHWHRQDERGGRGEDGKGG